MKNYFMNPLFEYMEFAYVDEAMEYFGFDYVRIDHDEMEDEYYERLSEGNFDPELADMWVELLTNQSGKGWKWAGYWVTEGGDECFMLVRPKHEAAAEAFEVMKRLYGSIEAAALHHYNKGET